MDILKINTKLNTAFAYNLRMIVIREKHLQSVVDVMQTKTSTLKIFPTY